ncbi:ATP-binding protein [Lysobacter silvisoli]|uniref:histidine kinase n=1 Tax=Lysobacter silvisoli TaxID=2293254 RepID=A0A371K290_9GAMM|nr:ATP-binding protein [Lysobacter silvisoli]RDZ27994.1 HAMP domain-containing protein [Lysobacter silvisoli]
MSGRAPARSSLAPPLSRLRLAPRIAIVVLLTMAMTLLIDVAVGMVLRSTGPTLVDEQSLVQQALDMRARLAVLPARERAAAAERATRARKVEFALLPRSDDRHGPPLSGLIENMRKRLVESPDTSGGAYAVSMNVLPDGRGGAVRQVTVVVPRLGAARGEILSVAARQAMGAPAITAVPNGAVALRVAEPLEALHADAESAPRTAAAPLPTVDMVAGPALPEGDTWTPTDRPGDDRPRLYTTSVQSLPPPPPRGFVVGGVVPGLLNALRPDLDMPRMSVATELPDGQWLLASPGKPSPRWLQHLLKLSGMLLLILAVAGLSMWTARSFVRPLNELSQAAERLGREREPTPIEGMTIPEYAAIAQTFNEMQVRLKRFVDDRTQQLAAISHDLRTPLTRMRLFAEYADDSHRERLLGEIAQMEAMIAGCLAFAGEDASLEPHQTVDLASLLISLCDDVADAGGDAHYEGPDHAYLPCQPIAMRRAFANLIDNGWRYGDRVRVSLSESDDALHVDVADDGPGIAPELYERAFAPFRRLDDVRGRHIAGSGLGLSIARSVVRGHGGDVNLAPGAQGGLLVRVELPKPASG